MLVPIVDVFTGPTPQTRGGRDARDLISVKCRLGQLFFQRYHHSRRRSRTSTSSKISHHVNRAICYSRSHVVLLMIIGQSFSINKFASFTFIMYSICQDLHTKSYMNCHSALIERAWSHEARYSHCVRTSCAPEKRSHT